MDNNALTPDAYDLPILDAEPIQQVEAQVIESATQDDKELAALNGSRGWSRIADNMRDDIMQFKTGGFIKDIESKGLEEVGKLFVIHQTVASILQGYLDKVDNATKSVVEHEQRNAK